MTKRILPVTNSRLPPGGKFPLGGEAFKFNRGCCLLFNGTRAADPVSLLNSQPMVSPCERCRLSLAASPCITRGRGGWLGLTPVEDFTSYPLPASLAHSVAGQVRAWFRRDWHVSYTPAYLCRGCRSAEIFCLVPKCMARPCVARASGLA
jgi:hypothetical protein